MQLFDACVHACCCSWPVENIYFTEYDIQGYMAVFRGVGGGGGGGGLKRKIFFSIDNATQLAATVNGPLFSFQFTL